eukprot:2462646-Rhodomonas_salina.1
MPCGDPSCRLSTLGDALAFDVHSLRMASSGKLSEFQYPPRGHVENLGFTAPRNQELLPLHVSKGWDLPCSLFELSFLSGLMSLLVRFSLLRPTLTPPLLLIQSLVADNDGGRLRLAAWSPWWHSSISLHPHPRVRLLVLHYPLFLAQLLLRFALPASATRHHRFYSLSRTLFSPLPPLFNCALLLVHALCCGWRGAMIADRGERGLVKAKGNRKVVDAMSWHVVMKGQVKRRRRSP